MHFTLSDKWHIKKKKPKLKVNTWEVGCSTEFKTLAISVVDLTFDCCRGFSVSVTSRIKLSCEQHIQHHHTPSNFIDGQCYVPKMSAFNITSTFSSIVVPLFGSTFGCRLNSCVVRSWVHEGRQLGVRATPAQHPFSAVAQSKCLGNSKRNKTYRDNWVFWLLRSQQTKWLCQCKPKAEAQRYCFQFSSLEQN